MADPLTRGNVAGPIVVSLGVADQEREERRIANLPEVEKADDERERRHRRENR